MTREDRRAALLGLFAQESERRLARMAAGLLDLDVHSDPERLEVLFRDAHTVQGSAAVMGFADLAELALLAEDLLCRLHEGRLSATPPVVEALQRAVDDLRAVTDAGLRAAPTADLAAQGTRRLRAVLDDRAGPAGA